ncbi:MAG: IclR family transcriptional regulator [Aquisalimonadaceae bacterium]
MDKTLAKGLAVLEALVEGEGSQGVSQIARKLALSKSNTHRLLQTLSVLGYVASSDGKYRLTPKLWVLGADLISRLDVRRIAMPELEKLAEETRETVHLSVLDRDEVVYVEKIDSPQPVRAYTKIGGRAPAYCVATGKALLAFQPQTLIDRVAEHLQAYTSRTITHAQALSRELAEVRALGHAVNRGEWRDELGGIGAPIFDSHGAVIAALGISGPTSRVNATAVARFAPLVRQAARNVSRQMGATLGSSGLPE